jgi:eukaryotic-like serine/threonine-protein kinase
VDAAPASSSLIGFALEGRYRIVREIGRGGMGVVFEAEHVELGKRVAIKVVLEKFAEDADAIARFRREALAASRIGSPHIIDVSHIGTAPDGRPFVVMELLDGMPLAKVLEVGPMDPARALAVMRQVLRAVGAAPAKGIIHRDLKPDNIFLVRGVDGGDFVKLLDFGISKFVDTGEHVAVTRLTSTGMVMGTPLYMAPEQATGGSVDHRVDIYACGVILFEMLSGRPPFNETNYNILVAKLITADPPSLASLRAGLPGKLISAVHRALEKEPEARFPSSEAFAAALPSELSPSQAELALSGTIAAPSGGLPAVPAVSTLQRPPRGRGRLVAAAVLAVIACAVAVVVVLSQRPPTPAAAGGAPSDPEAGSAVPAAATGKLVIRSIPDGANVYVGGALRGQSPLEIELAAGAHQVRVERADHLAVESEQHIPAGERISLVVPLPAAPPVPPSAPGDTDVKKPTAKPPVAKKPTARPSATPEPNPYAVPPSPPKAEPPRPDGPTRPTGPGTKPNPY